mmetsp:Transcript_49108/g.159150  ORF Transcript_49108/g.159150 Transcript_49108/m.159150 type:complete len:217 (-) Transcript_49108:11-661(-)
MRSRRRLTPHTTEYSSSCLSPTTSHAQQCSRLRPWSSFATACSRLSPSAERKSRAKLREPARSSGPSALHSCSAKPTATPSSAPSSRPRSVAHAASCSCWPQPSPSDLEWLRSPTARTIPRPYLIETRSSSKSSFSGRSSSRAGSRSVSQILGPSQILARLELVRAAVSRRILLASSSADGALPPRGRSPPGSTPPSPSSSSHASAQPAVDAPLSI